MLAWTHFVPLLQHLTGVRVQRDKLIGILNPDRGSRLLGLHPLWREGRWKLVRTDLTMYECVDTERRL